jgi:sulfide:quinone oxidoreductase
LAAKDDPTATPGFIEDVYEYLALAGAERLRDALPSFESGNVIISVLG